MYKKKKKRIDENQNNENNDPDYDKWSALYSLLLPAR